MSQAVATRDEASEVLTALLIPLADRQLLLVKGAVPGAKGSDVVVRPAVKA